MYERYSLKRIELLKELLGNLKISSCGRIASWVLDMDTKLRLSLKPEDSENLTDLIRGINTVEVAVFFEELKYGLISTISSRHVYMYMLHIICYI